ncbi:MAG: polyprenyl synthetase family protein [Proteobacteria bacterium]|nr:polyprenyl synthetase family protein [Pseudomonadota bacterium]
MKSQAAEVQRPFLAQLLREVLNPMPAMDEAPWSALRVPTAVWERALGGPLADFIDRPGKELRANLVEASWALGGGRPGAQPRELPYLVEMLHAGSLIVDDLQDGSKTRRGAPALHELYGLPTALNAGNWLYFWPLARLGRMALPTSAKLALFEQISTTVLRCHQGQALDLSCKVHALAAAELPPIVEATTALKTSALMGLAASMGAIAAGAARERVEALAAFGRQAGVGLQMLDDLGGLTSEDRAEKGLEDLRGARPTWPWAWLAAQADPRSYARAQAEAKKVADGGDPQRLRAILRQHVTLIGRRQADQHLDAALAGLRREVGPSRALGALVRDFDRMRKSYG